MEHNATDLIQSFPIGVEIAQNERKESDNPLFNTLGPCTLTDKQKASVQRRLEEKSVPGTPQTKVTGPCRLWTGTKNIRGYGQMGDGTGMKLVHRASYRVTHNVELRPDIHVLHLCANRACTNPSHLTIGTAQDNANDKIVAGRAPKADQHPFAKILNETALSIADAVKKGLKDAEIAAEFKCSIQTVNSIRLGSTWSSVTGIQQRKRKTPNVHELMPDDEEEARAYVEKRIEKVMEKIRGDNHEHWLWQLKAQVDGYGEASFHCKTYPAHVFAWRAFHQCREVPDGMKLLHYCRLRNCVNPYSLTLGDAAENMADKVRDGTDNRGMKHKKAKLTDDNVQEIRQLYSNGESQGTIAAKFGVIQQTVSHVVNKGWKHL